MLLIVVCHMRRLGNMLLQCSVNIIHTPQTRYNTEKSILLYLAIGCILILILMMIPALLAILSIGIYLPLFLLAIAACVIMHMCKNKYIENTQAINDNISYITANEQKLSEIGFDITNSNFMSWLQIIEKALQYRRPNTSPLNVIDIMRVINNNFVDLNNLDNATMTKTFQLMSNLSIADIMKIVNAIDMVNAPSNLRIGILCSTIQKLYNQGIFTQAQYIEFFNQLTQLSQLTNAADLHNKLVLLKMKLNITTNNAYTSFNSNDLMFLTVPYNATLSNESLGILIDTLTYANKHNSSYNITSLLIQDYNQYIKFIDRKTEIGNLPVNSVNTLGSKYSLTSLSQMQYVYDQLMNFKQYINTISSTSNINDIIMMMQTINIPSASGTLTPPSIMSIIDKLHGMAKFFKNNYNIPQTEIAKLVCALRNNP